LPLQKSYDGEPIRLLWNDARDHFDALLPRGMVPHFSQMSMFLVEG
jgi:hypothetical protein